MGTKQTQLDILPDISKKNLDIASLHEKDLVLQKTGRTFFAGEVKRLTIHKDRTCTIQWKVKYCIITMNNGMLTSLQKQQGTQNTEYTHVYSPESIFRNARVVSKQEYKSAAILAALLLEDQIL